MVFFSVFLSGVFFVSNASAATDVYYAGFAYGGQFKDIKKNFKYTQMINETTDGRSYLDVVFGGFFSENKTKMNDINLKMGEMSVLKSDSKIAMALAVTREGVVIDKFSDIYKIVVNLFCQVIFMDFEEKKILASYPLYLEYIDSTKTKPDDAHLKELMRGLYTDSDHGIIGLLSERIGSFRVRFAKMLSVQVENIALSNDAMVQLKEIGDGIAGYKDQIAGQYSDILSSDLGIPVLPPSRDSIGGKISLVFSDTKAQNFQIPEPAYSADINISNLKIKTLEENSVETALAFGAYVRFKIYEKEYNRIFFDEEIIHGSSKNVPKSQLDINEVEAFTGVIRIAMKKSIIAMKRNKKTRKEFIEPCLKY